MPSQLKEIFSSVPIDQWRTQSTLILDWYDGPLEGICVLERPACVFYFRWIGDWYNPEGLDDRIFEVSEFRELTEAQLQDLTISGTQVVEQPSEEINLARQKRVDAIIASHGEPTFIIRSADMTRFEAIWNFWATKTR